MKINIELVFIRGAAPRGMPQFNSFNAKSMALPEFQVFQDRAGEYRWNLVARNGETVCVSEGYTTRYSAWQSAKRIREIASTAVVRDIDV